MKYKYGCLMLGFKSKLIKQIQKNIDVDDLHENGMETEHHITILYGLVDKKIDDKEMIEFMKSIQPFNVYLSMVNLFENEEFDVLKIMVVDPKLHLLHTKCKEFPNKDKFPVYKPHSTIAYLKPGTGYKYTTNYEYESCKITEVIYSKSNGKEIVIKL